MKRILLIALALAISLPAVAEPVPKKVAPSAMAKARDHFKKGQAFHANGKYDEAIAEYKAAYELALLPDLLFNLAQVQRLKDDKRGALDTYLQYLEEAPNGRGADESRQWVASLSKAIRDEDDARRQRQDEEDKKLREERDADRAADEKRRAEMVAGMTDQPPPAPRPAGQTLRIAGLISGGVGVVGLGLGVYFSLHAKSLSDEQKNLSEWDPNLVSDGKAANRNAIISFSVAGAAIAAGGVMYYLGVRKDREQATPSVTVLPAIGPGTTGLVLGGRF